MLLIFETTQKESRAANYKLFVRTSLWDALAQARYFIKIQVVKEHNMYKQQQKLQGHNLVFISFQAVSYPLLEFLGHCRYSRKKEIEQINNLHIFF